MPLSSCSSHLSVLKTKTAVISMEATCFAASQPPLLHPKFPYPIKSSEIATTKSRPFICAVISKSLTVEISPKPTTPVSRGKPLQASPPPLPRVSSESLQYPAGYLAARTEHPSAHAGDGEQRRRRRAVVGESLSFTLYVMTG
ncbi:hypothetical protein Acr_29g0008920 [Actinidia rufa]|uniref:Uncharacterized protein n=1 Tax=Actinidia rufa TaxID=165716 RepID=A0A7J0HF21_9ERIC|nr:hypothetical protein Acr_29g0008920 [Actinidia rufa]